MDELIPQYVCESNLIKETNSNQPSAWKKEKCVHPAWTCLAPKRPAGGSFNVFSMFIVTVTYSIGSKDIHKGEAKRREHLTFPPLK